MITENKSTAFLSDFVQTKSWNHKGRVYKKHSTFYDTGHDEQWFAKQNLPKETKNEPWYSILVHGNGAVLVPESDLVKVSAEWWFSEPFLNKWEDFHFRV